MHLGAAALNSAIRMLDNGDNDGATPAADERKACG
jgi:hypothetical protein